MQLKLKINMTLNMKLTLKMKKTHKNGNVIEFTNEHVFEIENDTKQNTQKQNKQ